MIPLTSLVTIGAVAIVNVVLFWFIPRLTRRDLYFAVTVIPGFRDEAEGKSILRNYRKQLVLVSMLALMAVAAGVFWLGAGFVPAACLTQLGLTFVPFYRARQRVLSHAVPPTTVRETDLHGRNRIIPGGWGVGLGPFILLAGCAIYLRTRWVNIPTTFPVHWGVGGKADRWATRSFATVYFPLLSAAGVLLVLTIILYGILHWTRFVHSGGVQAARELKFRRTVSAVLVAAEYLVAAQSCWAGLSTLRRDSNAGPASPAIALLPLFLGMIAIVAFARLGQGGTRIGVQQETSDASIAPVGDRMEDKCWKLGVLYFNRDDPAVLIEKRFGLGYTLNFARPVTWVLVLLVFMGALAPVLISRLYH
jgi:uncharacterized membrane protein